MQVRYKSNSLRKTLEDASAIKKKFGVNAKRVAQRMADIRASANLAELCAIPPANCHELAGKRKGEWAVDISANHRLLFTIDHDPIPLNADGSTNRIMVTAILVIAASEDYH